MSKRELARVEVLARVRSKQLRVVDAHRLLGVSYRQAKRLWKRYREEGAAGLQHRSAGRSSNHGHKKKFRQKVLQLVREKYGGAVGERFGPTLAAEHLEDALQVDAETLRRWRVNARSVTIGWCGTTIVFSNWNRRAGTSCPRGAKCGYARDGTAG
jgi:transposase